MKNGSWKTSGAGIAGAIAIIATQILNVLDTDPATVVSLEAIFAALSLIGIGWFARDNKVTSEEAGAK